ncbi:MAG: tRNA-specific 2-thiouridylase [Deltaproteobacteria bacterium]|jgi:tRNA-specific 2-thiouridylase|nr:tRNA-specific 2-thiouridylase [Deltaproteobacteria bacterium]
MTSASRSIAVAVSGGLDSLYALIDLHARGLAAMALHARLLPPGIENDPVPGLTRICERLGLPLHVVEARREFAERVIRPFVTEYAAARTPNPCARCNARIKFGLLLDAARDLGAVHLATGHYAAWAEHPIYGPALRRGTDERKDQSYFLALAPGERLASAVFPLAEQNKAQLAARLAGLDYKAPLPGESQEICFVPGNAYRPFMRQQGVALPGPGPIELADGRVIGRHEGLWLYTEGQRRGLGLSWSEPLYVLAKNTTRNALIVVGRDALLADSCTGRELNELVPRALWPDALYVQTRYRQRAVPATVHVDSDRIAVRFAAPQTPAAPGQILAVYDARGWVLAGASIDS